MIILEDLKDIIIDFWLEQDGKDKHISRGQY